MKTKSLLFLCTFFASTLVFGETYTVTNTNESGEGSFAWAYSSATSAEDIITFNVDANEFTLSIVIENSLTIDGLNQFNSQRVILKKLQANKFADLVGTTVTFKNLIIDGEDMSSAIGISADNSSTLNIDNCILRNINSGGAANNGGACRIQGIATIKNSLFENNTQGSGTYGGGAICIYNNANVTIENTSFIGNIALAGGAIMANGTVATGYILNVSNCTFANNEASLGTTNRRGGAVYLQGPTATESNATFTNCTFTGNSAVNNGGAICAFASANKKININLINSILTHNMSGGNKYSDIDVWNLDSRVYFPTATNCIYGSLLGTATGINWISSINPLDISTADIFYEKEVWLTSFERPVTTSTKDDQKLVLC
jgi:predicted outer membrane repeat protein